jgi:PilZ domain-containing protein
MESAISPQQPEQALRRWTRYKIDVRLKVSFSDQGKHASAFGRANSLSRRGLGAYIPCSIPVGSTVALELTLPFSSTEARLEAVVRNCEGFRYGVEFTRVPAEIQAVLAKHCDPEVVH